MKKVKLSFIIVMSIIFTSMSCQNGDDNTEEPGTISGEKISAKIDGVYWESTEGIAAYISVDKTLNLAGGPINGNYSIYGGLKKPIDIGTYDIIERGDLTLNVKGKLYLAGVSAFTNKPLGSGKLTVIEIDKNKNFRATFEAVVVDGQGNTIKITEGKINGY
jgi:hypothetical protein